ncbi:MAG TPA: sigma 54-interacting transcriptional regulator [Polyangia bacterium]|nr:sigma 54-interacting transcriptional regulator [Polyangia bacterium]
MLWLSVSEDGRAWSVPLPSSGRISIGRASENDVVLKGPLVSRVHAVVHVGAAIEVEDTGSANGTSVRQEGLRAGQRVEVQCGDSILIGSAALVIHGRGLSAGRIDKQVSGEALTQKLAAFGQSGGGVTVARLRLSSELHAQWVTALVCEALPEASAVAWLGRGLCGIVVAASAAEHGAAALRALTEKLVAWGVRASVDERHVAWPAERERLNAALALLGPDARAAERERAGSIVRDPAMQKLFAMIERVAVGTISVLVLGETGVGKEVVARAVHAASPRHDQPFVGINCAAMSETLIESELFGHEAGAFTGARAAKLGLIESAHRGTLLLDEVGELPLSTQVKLLRVLETREVLRIGGVTPRPVDLRVVAATNRNLAAAVARGTFREDLLFRLNGVTLSVPPLRERKAEIEPLARQFVAAMSAQLGRPAPRLHEATLELLLQHSWPGNVRELRNVLERAVLLCADDAILPEDLPAELQRADGETPIFAARDGAQAGAPESTAEPAVPGERERIVAALDACAGNQTRASEMLKMPRRTLDKRLRQYDIPRPRTRTEEPD